MLNNRRSQLTVSLVLTLAVIALSADILRPLRKSQFIKTLMLSTADIDLRSQQAVKGLEICSCLQVKPQTVSNLLWAYATLGWAPTHLLNSLAVETLRQLPYFKPQELANSLWAYATLKYNPMPEWLGQIGVACEGQVGGCKPQELSSMLWALGSLKHHPGAAFLRIATDTARR